MTAKLERLSCRHQVSQLVIVLCGVLSRAGIMNSVYVQIELDNSQYNPVKILGS